MEVFEQKYHDANAGIKTAQEIMNEQKENFETKERFKDATINYPNYGRGLIGPNLQPPRELGTYMNQLTMCPATEEEKKKRAASRSGSPKADIQAQQRKRILSPRR